MNELAAHSTNAEVMVRKIFVVLALMFSATAWAGDLEDAVDAYYKQDYSKALVHFKIAAAQGLADAQLKLAHMYNNGQGVPQDYVEAARLYKLAAAQGHIGAQLNLGFMYEVGEGVAQNFIQAHAWYNLAAAQGLDLAFKLRNDIAKKMTPQQIAEAQKLARECLARNYKNCD